MPKDIYVARKPLLKKGIKIPIALLSLGLLMFTGFLAVKTKPAQACRPPVEKVCPDGSVKFEVGTGYQYSDGSGTITIHPGCCGHNSASWEAAECYAIIGVCIKIGGPGGGTLIDGLSQGGGPFAYDISHVVLTTNYTCEPEEILGCTDPEAINYDPEATVDDGSCEYAPEEIEGCTDPEALNYNADATIDDGSCKFPAEPTPIPTPTPTPEPGKPGPPGPPVCGASTPAAPYLISATAIGGNRVELKWGKVDGATHYSIFYGPSSGNYLYGVPNTGNTDNFIIEGMSSGCYAVRAVNDCAPSEASNEVCIGAVGGVGQVLGLSTTSGNDARSLYFWGGILSLLFGTRILAQELQRKRV